MNLFSWFKKPAEPVPQVPVFAFCESTFASGGSRWHIRRLSAVGLKLGGGADTKALCGREVAWDLSVPLTDFHVNTNACTKCAELLRGNNGLPEVL